MDDVERIYSSLKSGKSLEYVVIKGHHPLQYALALYDEDLALQIINHDGVDIDMLDSNCFTPLHLAVQAGLDTVVKALIMKGASLEMQTADMRIVTSYESGGRTPLHITASRGDVSIALLLLQAGSNRDAQDWDGHTPWDLAILNKHNDMATLLDAKRQAHPLEYIQKRSKDMHIMAKTRVQKMMTPTWLEQTPHILPAVWTQKECEDVLKELLAHTTTHGWSTKRHGAYATTDIQSCEIHKIDGWTRHSIEDHIFPELARFYTYGPGLAQFSFRDLFFVKYEGKLGAQSHLDTHKDGSILSFNILLNPRSDFEGGGTYFQDTDTTLHIQQGDCLLHSGQMLHGGATVTSGVRYILVGFVDIDLQRKGSVRIDHGVLTTGSTNVNQADQADLQSAICTIQ